MMPAMMMVMMMPAMVSITDRLWRRGWGGKRSVDRQRRSHRGLKQNGRGAHRQRREQDFRKSHEDLPLFCSERRTTGACSKRSDRTGRSFCGRSSRAEREDRAHVLRQNVLSQLS
jgi:hypothetical protein